MTRVCHFKFSEMFSVMSITCTFGCHHKLVDRYKISISRMAMNFSFYVDIFLSTIINKTFTGLNYKWRVECLTDLMCSRKSYLSSRLTNSTVVITNWLTFTNVHFSYGNESFPIYLDFFSSIMDKTFTRVDYE